MYFNKNLDSTTKKETGGERVRLLNGFQILWLETINGSF